MKTKRYGSQALWDRVVKYKSKTKRDGCIYNAKYDEWRKPEADSASSRMHRIKKQWNKQRRLQFNKQAQELINDANG